MGGARRRQRPHLDFSAGLRLGLWTGARRPARSRRGPGAGGEIRGAARHNRGRDQGADPVADRAGRQRRVPDRDRRVCLAADRDPGQPRERPLYPGADGRGDRPSARARHPHPGGARSRAGLPDRIEGGRHAEERRRAAWRADDARRCRLDVAGAAQEGRTHGRGFRDGAGRRRQCRKGRKTRADCRRRCRGRGRRGADAADRPRRRPGVPERGR